MIKRDLFVALSIKIKFAVFTVALTSVSFSVFTPKTTRGINEVADPSGVTRTRIRVIGVNFDEFVIR